MAAYGYIGRHERRMKMWKTKVPDTDTYISFDPAPDLTIIELAAITNHMLRMDRIYISRKSWNEMDIPIKRHFKEIP